MRKSQEIKSADASVFNASLSNLSSSGNKDAGSLTSNSIAPSQNELDELDNSIGDSKVIKTVLIVDPDPDFSSTVSDYLKLFGYNIGFRTEISDALAYVKNQSSDIILLADNFEYNHPIDVLRRFKKAQPSALIAILASRGDDQLAVELLKAGADDYLSRKVKDNDILTAIASLLERLPNNLEKQIQHRAESLKTQTANQSKDDEPTEAANYSSPQMVESRPKNGVRELSFITDLPGNLVFIDHSFTVLSSNHGFSNLLGFPSEEIAYQSIKRFVPSKLFTDLVIELNRASEADGSSGQAKSNQQNQEEEIGLTNQDNTGLPTSRISSSFEMVLLGNNGNNVPVRCQVSTLQLSLEENVTPIAGYLVSVEDLSNEKAKQAKLFYKNMWSNLLNAFAHKFINLHLDDFATEITNVVSETAGFFRLDRISIYLFDKSQQKAKIYLEWLRAGDESLKVFSKKIDVSQSMIEFEKLFADQIQIIQPSNRIEESTMDKSWGLSEHYSQVNAQSSIVIPISIKSKVVGWMSMDYQDKENGWKQEDRSMIEAFRSIISQAFELRAKEEQRKVTHQKLSENYGLLSEQAFLDGLTNLANRRYFDKVLESEVRRASREETNIALLFCDVDYFKAYNDNYGHMEGDLCLKSIAETMQKEFQRAGDFVARFGGEEFAVILSGTLADDAFDAAEKLRKRIYAMNLEHKGSPIGKIAMSIGISSIIAPEPNDSKRLLSKADKALYKAKNKGRNRVEISAFSPR